MAVRKLRANQRHHTCSFCDRKAVYRGVYFTRFACIAHHPELSAEDGRQAQRDAYPSEAEWQLQV